MEGMTLEDMVNMDGVRENECLQRIREDVFVHAMHYSSVKRMLYNGEFDYKCPGTAGEDEELAVYGYHVDEDRAPASMVMMAEMICVVMMAFAATKCVNDKWTEHGEYDCL